MINLRGNKNPSERCSYCGELIKKGDLAKHKQEMHGDLVLNGMMKIAETLSSKAIDRIIDRSEKLIVQGDPESAIFALRQVLETYPNNKKASKTLALASKKIRQKRYCKKM